MKLPWRRRDDNDSPRPDPQTARAHLRRVQARRGEVEALVELLKKERQLNNFSANLTATFRGGRP